MRFRNWSLGFKSWFLNGQTILRSVLRLWKASADKFIAIPTLIQFLAYQLFYHKHIHMGGPELLSRYSDSLLAGRSGDRIPVGRRFSAPLQTGPGAYRAFCTMGTGSFPGVKRPGRVADHPPPSKRRGHVRVGLYLYSTSGPQWSVIGRNFTFTFICTL